ncbi:hypothetical protein PRUPE_7G101700 [Prunus persica]|uniref:Uncharacterized protein n=1 Tax=Prunus persica TaxID=3760 RepID=A0A251N9K0_PRUPE|nr:hypothetical protein PRUPE_7G101700 [Prunus persica]
MQEEERRIPILAITHTMTNMEQSYNAIKKYPMTSLKHLSVHNNAIDFRHLTNSLKEHMLTVIRALDARGRKKDQESTMICSTCFP